MANDAADIKSPAGEITAGKGEFIWKGPIYKKTTVPVWYYVILIVIALLLAGGFYLANQPLSIVVVAASLLFLLVHANDVPKAHRYQISDDGITIEDNTFTFQDLKSFWVSDEGILATLYVEQLGRFSLPLSIPLKPADTQGIRTILRKHLPESRRRGDLLIDILARMTGIN